MKTSQENLLKLIRISLWGPDGLTFTSKPDWNKVLLLARQQTVLGLVAEAIPYLPEEYRPDQEIAARLHAIALNICLSHSLLNRKLAELKSRLDAAGVNSVLFKGQGVAINYPNPQSRQCGDIDMYVGERNFKYVFDTFNTASDKHASDYKNMKHFDLEEDGVSIEIHRIAEIIPGRRRNRLFQEWTVRHLEGPDLHNAEIGGASINLPPHQFNALYIMNHAWHHFVHGGIGLRQLCDWTMFLHRHHSEIDHDLLSRDLEAFGLSRAWQILAGVAVGYLGLPAEECPLYDSKYVTKSRMMMEVIWNEGNFGFYSSDRKKQRPEGHFAGKLHSFRISTRRRFRIISISPADVFISWISYFKVGMSNLFVRIK